MTPQQELEIVIYAKVTDLEGLGKADSIEDHVQLESRLMDGNKIRIRKTTKPNEAPSYMFTAKVKNASNADPQAAQDAMEYDAPVDEKLFELYENVCEQRIEKRRYTFGNRSVTLTLDGISEPLTVEGISYEVDQFKCGTEVVEYVKIDVEVQKILSSLSKSHPELKTVNMLIKLGKLPFQASEIIYRPTATEEQKQLIEELWKIKFSQKRVPDPKVDL